MDSNNKNNNSGNGINNTHDGQNNHENTHHAHNLEHEVREQKVKKLRELGIDPWPAFKEVDGTCAQVISEFKDGESKKYSISGRMISRRTHGKAAFATLMDRTGKLQVYIKTDNVGADKFKIFEELFDLGDIIWCSGTSFRTKMGEITLLVEQFELLSKCLYPLPEKFHGLADIEVKYRQRYLDLITSEATRDRFIKRTKILRSIRNFFNSHDFLEVETPMLHPIAGGAAAKPFKTHHNALDTELYLRIAPELYLKRLVVGGFERVYEINRNFRNEGISTRHNPEFTMLEFYMANEDYHFIMNFVEELLRNMAREVCGTDIVDFGDKKIDFGSKFKKLTVKQSVVEIGGLTEADLLPENIDNTIKKYKIDLPNKSASLGAKIFALFEELVEKKIVNPTFIIDYPIEISPLAKRDSKNPNVAARFELFVAGMEISNGFNELNDPYDQAQRFHEQVAAYEAGDQEAHQYDADYVHALEYGLPPTVGVGIGIDRLVMLMTNTTSIKDVILFPTLKPAHK